MTAATSRRNDQRQHYISSALMKRWADDDGKVGVVCLYHRRHAILSAKALHYTTSLSSPKQEAAWGRIENDAIIVIDKLTGAITPDGDGLEAAEQLLADKANVKALIDFAVLHHARSIAVPLHQRFDDERMHNLGLSATTIEQRERDATDYHDCGIVVTAITEPDARVHLGAVPVFDTKDWDPSRSNVRFMMPLTPRLMLSGVKDLPAGDVVVTTENPDSGMLWLHLAGEPGLFSPPYVICEPSVSERTAESALARTVGAAWHWFALHGRAHQCAEAATPKQLDRWLQTITRYEGLHGMHADATTTNSMRAKHRRAMTKLGGEFHAELDTLGAPICDCGRLRHDPDTKAFWKLVMPQVICDAMRG